MFIFNTDRYIYYPFTWYGLLLSLGILISYYLTLNKIKVIFPNDYTKKTDSLAFITILLSILFSRLFHILFYEHPSTYINNPLIILKIWEGGLASHGGFLGALLGIYISSKKINISFYTILNILLIPFLITASLIRIGNFINQEILGTQTSYFLGVTFLSPFNNDLIIPRHPVQLYESITYISISIYLKFIKYSKKRIALFTILVFSSRFLLEIYKEHQSKIINGTLSMGQLLSIPFIVIGIVMLKKSE